MAALPFDDGAFDLITAVQTHYFWPDLEKGVSEAYRVLKDGGTFIIISELYKIQYHMNRYKDKDSMRKLFTAVGFPEVRIRENDRWITVAGVK